MDDRGRLLIAVVVVLLLVVAVRVAFRAARRPPPEAYSAGYQIGPHYLGTSSWAGDPYALTYACIPDVSLADPAAGDQPRPAESAAPRGKSGFESGSPLVYEPPFTEEIRGNTPDWWNPQGGTYGLPPAADRPDFWAGDATIHTILARDPIPPWCDPAAVADGRRRPTAAEDIGKWRYYGGSKGWTFSKYY